MATIQVEERFIDNGNGHVLSSCWYQPDQEPAGVVLIALSGITVLTASGWADIIVGVLLVLLNGSAAKEIWEAATEEHLAAQALAGEVDDD